MLFLLVEEESVSLVAMVTKGEVSGGGVGGRVGAESLSFCQISECLTFGDCFLVSVELDSSKGLRSIVRYVL